MSVQSVQGLLPMESFGLLGIIKGDLKTVENLILGDILRILSGLSTISGGFGSG